MCIPEEIKNFAYSIELYFKAKEVDSLIKTELSETLNKKKTLKVNIIMMS